MEYRKCYWEQIPVVYSILYDGHIFNSTKIYRPVDQDDDDDSFDGLSEDSDTAHLKPRRQYWANKMQFVLACIGYSVGKFNFTYSAGKF